MEPYADATLDAVAGAGGALLALLTTYPLMTLNTRQHTEHRAGKQKGRRDGTSDAPTPKRGMVAELRQLINEEGGVTALYRGVEPAIIGTVASQFVYNYFYSAMRNKYIATKRTNPGPLSNLAIASAAGCVNVMCTIPIWTITTRMQARRKKMESAGGRQGRAGKKKNGKSLLSSSWAAEGKETDDDEDEGESMKGFLATAREVWNDGGAAGFWQGVVPSLVMVSNPAMQYGAFILISVRAIRLSVFCFTALYETVADGYRRARCKRRLTRGAANTNANEELSAWEVFAAASLAKLGATVVTYPILLVKSR